MLQDLIIILTLFSAIGFAVDKFLLLRHKRKLYDKLMNWWVRLEETAIPNIHLVMVERTLKWLDQLVKNKTLLIISSIVLTLTASTLGIILDHGGLFPLVSKFLSNSSNVEANQNILVMIIFMVLFPAINLIFDGATLYVTIFLLRKITHLKRRFVIPIVIIDVSISAVFTILCFIVLFLILFFFKVVQFTGVLELIELWFNVVHEAIFNEKKDEDAASLIFFTLTTFIPTLLYFATFIFLFTSKIILNISKSISSYFLEVSLDRKPHEIAPFTLLGVTIGVLVSILKTLDHFLLS